MRAPGLLQGRTSHQNGAPPPEAVTAESHFPGRRRPGAFSRAWGTRHSRRPGSSSRGLGCAFAAASPSAQPAGGPSSRRDGDSISLSCLHQASPTPRLWGPGAAPACELRFSSLPGVLASQSRSIFYHIPIFLAEKLRLREEKARRPHFPHPVSGRRKGTGPRLPATPVTSVS